MVAPTPKTPAGVKPKIALGDFGLNEIWDVIQRRKQLIILSVVLMWMLGLAYCFYAEQTYESSAQVLVMRKDPAVSTTGSTSGASSEKEVSEEELATQLQIVQSERIIRKALDQTIKQSDLKKFKAEFAAMEAQTSTNLRFLATRMFQGQTAAPSPTETPATTPATTGADANAMAPAADASASPAATAPVETMKPVEAAKTEAPATTPAASAPVFATSATATPTTGTTDPAATTTPATPESSVAAVEEEITSITLSKKRKLLSSDPNVLPPGPQADGDMVLRLSDLPMLVEKLDTNQQPEQYVAENLILSRGGSGQARTSHVLTVAFRHPDAVEARLILDAVVEEYQQFLTLQFQAINHEVAKIIEIGAEKQAKKLENAQNDYSRFREQAPILFGGTSPTNIYRTRFETAQAEVTTIQMALSEARARLKQVELGAVELTRPDSDPWEKLALVDEKNSTRIAALVTMQMSGANINDPQVLWELQKFSTVARTDNEVERSKLVDLKGRRDSLLQLYGPKHGEILKLDAEIASVEKNIQQIKAETKPVDESVFKKPSFSIDPDKLINSYVRLLRMDVRVLERKEQELLEMAATQEELAKTLEPYVVEEERLRTALATEQAAYDAMFDRLRDINLAKDYSGFVNEILVTPESGLEVWPSLPIVIVVATMLGMLLGVGGAAMQEYRDRSFRDPEDIRRDLGLPLLTHIPNLHSRSADKRQLVEGSKMHPTVYAYHRPKSREAEVFRGLRTSLFFSTQGQKCQVLGFTSPNQGDGKSTVTANLAVSIAQTGRKVLLVDCDLRRPNVHKMLGLSNDVGLSDVVGGEIEPWDAIQQTETTNLWSLPSGPLPANPAELLTSSTFEQFVKMAREKYDYILLDCPPVLAVADPCIVAPRTDGVTLVLRVSKDSRPQAMRAREMLDRVGARMLGVVVNASQEAQRSGYGRYGESSYAYSYDYGYGGYGYSSYNKYYEDDSVAATRGNGSGR